MTTPTLPRLDTATQDPETDVLTVPDLTPELDEPGAGGGSYRVILYDDDWHSFDQVLEQLIKACEYDARKAAQIVISVDAKGRDVCYQGSRSKCHQVARVLREIRLQCEVDNDD